MTEVRQINFDMDGTIANLYGVEGWLEYIIDKDETPYVEAKPLVNLSALAKVLNRLQRNGYELNIISWLAKNSDDVYDEKVILAKKNWLKKHMPSVKWNNINIVSYGTPKQNLGQGILFDDEKPNRDNWNGTAYDVDNIVGTLKKLA
jgi:hypothetical protein